MAGKDVAATGAALTADGDTGGVGQITVASTTTFRAKAHAYVGDDNSTPVEVIIVDIVSATIMKVRLVFKADGLTRNPGSYGYSTMAAFTTGQNERTDIPSQFVQ